MTLALYAIYVLIMICMVGFCGIWLVMLTLDRKVDLTRQSRSFAKSKDERLPAPAALPVFDHAEPDPFDPASIDYRTNARPVGDMAGMVTQPWKPECRHTYPAYFEVQDDGARVLRCILCGEWTTIPARRTS